MSASECALGVVRLAPFPWAVPPSVLPVEAANVDGSLLALEASGGMDATGASLLGVKCSGPGATCASLAAVPDVALPVCPIVNAPLPLPLYDLPLPNPVKVLLFSGSLLFCVRNDLGSLRFAGLSLASIMPVIVNSYADYS